MGFKENKEYGLYSNDEYQGQPTKNKLIFSTVMIFVFVALSSWWTTSMYTDFRDLENNVRDIRLHSIAYFLYQIGGKWLALTFPVGCGVFFLVLGFKGVGKILKGDYEK